MICLDMLGDVGMYVDMCEYVLIRSIYSDMFRYVWVCSDLFGYSQICSNVSNIT